MKKYDKIILILLLVVFAAGIGFTARQAFETYVPFAEARESGRAVQVKGTPVDASLIEYEGDTFSFELVDMEGETQRVTHTGTLPQNLFEADYVVVNGRFDGDEFVGSQLLVKCPSKYAPEEE